MLNCRSGHDLDTRCRQHQLPLLIQDVNLLLDTQGCRKATLVLNPDLRPQRIEQIWPLRPVGVNSMEETYPV